MRLLHTSDWHLGRSLHGADLGEAHAAWVDHVVDTVEREHVDVVLVAGDVFDRAIAPLSAVRAWDRAVERVAAAGAALVVSSGNHDSAVRLAAHAGLLRGAGLHVRGDLTGLTDPVVLHDEHGPVAFYPVPFLEPTTQAGVVARLAAPGLDPVAEVPRTQAGVVGRACQVAAAHARAHAYDRTVVLAHTWAAGIRREDLSDSERDIGSASPQGCPADAATRVGTLDRVPVTAFEDFSYAALGHLHGRSTLREGVRYSGSPLAFSFSERRHRKGGWLVELDGAGLAEVRWDDAPVHRALTELRGTLAELLGDPAHAAAEQHWVKAVLTDPVRPADAMRRLQTRFPHAVALELRPAGAGPGQVSGYGARLAEAPDDTAVAAGFVEHVRGAPVSAAERDVLARAFRAVATHADAGGEQESTARLDEPVPRAG